MTPTRFRHKNDRLRRTVATVVSVATAVCDQVVTVQHVDDIDEVHQLDPVHQVDHKDELWGDPGANFSCFFFEVITFCALVGAIFIFSSKSSIFGPWLGGQVSENNHRGQISFDIRF